MTLSRHPVRLQPHGSDTLEVRERYIRRQHSRSRDVRRMAIWVALGAVACFLAAGGLTVLVVGSS